jgi:hypothetical protein
VTATGMERISPETEASITLATDSVETANTILDGAVTALQRAMSRVDDDALFEPIAEQLRLVMFNLDEALPLLRELRELKAKTKEAVQ